MSEIDVNFDEYDEADGECPNCDGSGYVDSCFEDTCVCREPPCHRIRCDWCNHDGKKDRPPVDRSHGERPEPPPPGPLLEIMERDK